MPGFSRTPRHVGVGQQAVPPRAAEARNPLLRIGEGMDLVPVPPERRGDGREAVRVVVEYENLRLLCHRTFSGSGLPDARSRILALDCSSGGRKIVTVVPRPSRLRMPIFLPCSRTIFRTMGSPSPVPFFLVEQKRWQNCFRSA